MSVTGPNAPQGASFLLEDTVRGGIWLGGTTETSQGLTYFDGSRFISPFRDSFPKVTVTGMAEDEEGGIWLGTSGGIYRAFDGRLEQVVKGVAPDGIVRIGPELFLAMISKVGASNAALLRISRAKDGKWKGDIMLMSSIRSIPSQPDSEGDVLYRCAGGYCEFRSADAANWRLGTPLTVIKHLAPEFGRGLAQSGIVIRDRFGCVWLRGDDADPRGGEIIYKCPGVARTHEHAVDRTIVGPGSTTISELEDGTIVIPSFDKLAIGRPGHFRIYKSSSGYPGTLNTVNRRDGIWLSNSNGLFVMPRLQRMEFWTERDGLDGNTWSILHQSGKAFAVAGQTLHVLSNDRSRWIRLPMSQPVANLSAGTNNIAIVRTTTGQTLQFSTEGKLIGKLRQLDAPTPLDRSQADKIGDLQTCAGVYKTAGIHATPYLLNQMCVSFVTNGKRNIWHGNSGWYADNGLTGLTLIDFPDGLHPRAHEYVSGGEVGVSTVRFLGVDQRGWIWRGSPVGIYVASSEQARQGHWLYLNRQDGIAGTDANSGSFFSDADGSVWFGLDNSVNHLYPPPDLLSPREAPEIFISSYSLNGGESQMADMVPSIKSRVRVTAHIGSLQFDRRNALRVRYRVLPEQASWRESRNLDLELGRLPTGSHTIEVQGRILTGPWSETTRRSMTILPPVWLTGPFLIPSVLAILALCALWGWLQHRRVVEERTMMPDLRDWRTHAFFPETQELLGATLDARFEVGDLLASGGFATVMAGFDRNEHRVCALKIFRSEVMNKTSLLRGFQQEVAALQQICHPNVVSIYADGLTPTGAPYLAMEFIEGKSLREILKNGPLTAARTGRILRQLASALDAIHAREIFHRDVKPENVLVRRLSGSNETSGEQAVLIDFSIAIIKNANETLHGISRAAGTFDYMAPEQALGYARPASDIFSLAKVVIEMLTGHQVSELLPNEALELPVLILETMVNLKLNLSGESVQMLASALEFDPSKRPSVATQFATPLVRDLTRL